MVGTGLPGNPNRHSREATARHPREGGDRCCFGLLERDSRLRGNDGLGCRDGPCRPTVGTYRLGQACGMSPAARMKPQPCEPFCGCRIHPAPGGHVRDESRTHKKAGTSYGAGAVVGRHPRAATARHPRVATACHPRVGGHSSFPRSYAPSSPRRRGSLLLWAVEKRFPPSRE